MENLPDMIYNMSYRPDMENLSGILEGNHILWR